MAMLTTQSIKEGLSGKKISEKTLLLTAHVSKVSVWAKKGTFLSVVNPLPSSLVYYIFEAIGL
ncbi:hypothetical protein N7456_008796 [Penicillium angulare]|uniref:Uncharacterized protein n=1 Tax=Penicillium angulare TaxID=116970 RepID=A0A9W9F3Q7_9EURO|nr:hypothetical protein N7456_008796 [Penicillium angulare]